ncbi:MAG: hypothetical protein ACKOWF_02590, partial [Chloroflexota bacterium]
MDQSSFDRIARLFGGVERAEARDGNSGKRHARGHGTASRHGSGKARRHSRRPPAERPCGDGSRKDNICTKDKQCCT